MAEQAYIANPIAGAGGRVIASPFQFVSDDDTNLMIVSVCSVTGVQLAIQGRRQDETGRTVPFVETHTPNSDRTKKTQFYKLGKGALLNLTVFALTGSLSVGQCYVSVRIVQGLSGATVVLGTLLGGAVTTTQALGFPGSVIVSSTDTEPAVRSIVGATPAAGVFITETCPSGARWELISSLCTYASDVAVGTRVVFIRVQFPPNPAFFAFAGATQQPSQFGEYSFAQNLLNASDTARLFYQGFFPQRQFLRAADQFVIGAFGMTALDQFSAPIYQVREWLEVS